MHHMKIWAILSDLERKMHTMSTTSPRAGSSAPAPLREEVGIREARTMLGRLADAAASTDQVTYLTKQGKRVAAVVSLNAACALQQAKRSRSDQPHIDPDSASTHPLAVSEDSWPQILMLAQAALRLADELDDSRIPQDIRTRIRHDQETARQFQVEAANLVQ